MIDFVMNWYGKLEPLAFWIYYLPLLSCGLYYTIKTYSDIVTDMEARANPKSTPYLYHYTTWGDLAARVFLTATPMVNCLPFLFIVCPDMVRQVYKRFGQFLNFPLIGPSKPKEIKLPE